MRKKSVQSEPVNGLSPEEDKSWCQALGEGAAEILRSSGSPDRVPELESGVSALHVNLVRFRAYQDAMKAARAARPSSIEPWVWRPLFETEALRMGFLVVYRYGQIPLHDHPGSSGVQLIIEGGVRIQQFQHQSGSESSGGLRVLELVRDRKFSEGEVASYTADTGNIHGLEAMHSSAVLFTVTAPPYRGEDRGWYYPVPLFPQKQSRFLVNRVARRTPRVQQSVQK